MGMAMAMKDFRPKEQKRSRALVEHDQMAHFSAVYISGNSRFVTSDSPYLYYHHVHATRDGARGTLSIFGHFPSSLQTEKSVSALDGRSPFDRPRDDIPPFPMLC